jgi:GMP synthase-like glutamine amidotransferase
MTLLNVRPKSCPKKKRTGAPPSVTSTGLLKGPATVTLRLHYLQHVAFEGLGQIGPWAVKAGAAISATRFFEDQPLPDVGAFDFLVIMGGPMGTGDTDRHPWLVREKLFVREAIAAGKAVLGVCLGAQLIAAAMEARVYPNTHREIGWFDIKRSPSAADHVIGDCFPPQLKVFHWHGDTFDLPAGALRIASSTACRNQGFVLGPRVAGLQFHLETTPQSLQALIANSGDDLWPGPYVQSPRAMRLENECYGSNHNVLEAILDRLASSVIGN